MEDGGSKIKDRGPGEIMAVIRSFRDLDVYKLALEQAKRIFLITRSFPKEEIYSLTDQIRRS